MSSTNRDLIIEEKARGDEEFVDIESGRQIESLQSASIPDAKPRSLITQREESSLLQKFLSYPSPGSLKTNSTSWLNGVRGVAALLVYVFHAFGCWFPLVPAWHADADQTNILQLPLIRTIFVSGGAAVSVFFALSGYVLTHKSLRWMREGSRSKVPAAVLSSMFRRGFRLYLPTFLLTFCEMLATRFGFPPPLNFSFTPESSFSAQFVDWIVETNYFVNPLYNFGGAIRGFVKHPKYDPVIWTIPLEFYGSFLCYILLLLIMRVPKNGVRMGLIAVVSVLCMLLGSWNFSCFTAGMLIADFNLGQDEAVRNSTSTSPHPSGYDKIWIAIFAIAFYIAGLPTLGTANAKINPMPGFEILRTLTPLSLNMDDHSRFWWSISGVSMLVSISQVPRLKRIFDTNPCQYLAKISFSLYLVHEFCIVLFGLSIQALMLRLAGLQPRDGSLLYWFLCVIWFLLFTLPVFALAAQVEKWVDVPSVKFAKWLEGKCLKGYRSTY